MNGWISTFMKHHVARHAAMAKPKTCARCPHCSRLCASEFRLRSHFRIHATILARTKQLLCNFVAGLDALQQQQQQQQQRFGALLLVVILSAVLCTWFCRNCAEILYET